LLPISQKKLHQPQWVTEEWAAWEEWTSKKSSSNKKGDQK